MIPVVARGKWVADSKLVRWLGLIGCLGAFAPGCWTYEINQRPVLSIVPNTTDPIYRGKVAGFHAETFDPDGEAVVDLDWRAYACTDALASGGCDPEPFDSRKGETFAVTIPIYRDDETTPVRSLRIVLDGQDERGATAKPKVERVEAVLNQPPEVVLSPSSAYGFVITTPIRIFADVTDGDDDVANVLPPVWELFAPVGATATLQDFSFTPPDDPLVRRWGKRLIPDVEGWWTVRATVTDPFGRQGTDEYKLDVGQDRPPALRDLQPIVAPAGTALPISEPTLFQVAIVDDDLDPYPSVPNDPFLGETRFAWSIKTPADTTHVAIAGVTGNSYALDPASFTPGDVIELRVEVFDRKSIPIECPDTQLTCSVISGSDRLQRQTWRVEVR
jgi:hypothetical protein